MKVQEYKEFIRGKKVGVIGIGKSNEPLILLLVSFGAEVVACDRRENLGELEDRLRRLGVRLQLGETYLDNLEVEILFHTPGIRPDLPQLQKAKEKGCRITSEMELFFELCPCKIYAVTGSDGKTTTTTLIYKMLEKEGYTCHLGGNIGNPLIGEIEHITPRDKVVVELSSFQLFDMRHSPDVAVVTNITPNHLDWHTDVEEYRQAKQNILNFQGKTDRAVLSYDDPVTRALGQKAAGDVFYFSHRESADIRIQDGAILVNEDKFLDIADIKVIGKHNIDNYMAAIGAVWGEVSKETVTAVAKEFGGVEHRIELVRTLRGVKYYNSSIDSSPNRTKHTLSVFDGNVVLIAGGKDKGIPYDDVGAPIREKVKTLILIGKTADKIEAAVRREPKGNLPEILRCETYEEAVSTAQQKSESGDTVLLSPASTSFDRFNNFEERGNLFKKLVMELS